MTESSEPRPRQVTLAAWLIMLGSAAVVLLVFDRLTGLHTLETRESVRSFLSEPPGSDLDLGVDGALAIIRTLGMVAAGCATAAGILGYHVLRRSRSARLVLTVLAVPLFLTGMVTGGFLPAVVAASAALLWLQPARDWFDERAAGAPPDPAREATPAAPPTASTGARGPVAGYQTPVAPAAAYASPARPSAVRWACVLTWICTGVTTFAVALSAVALALDPDLMIDQARRQSPELAEQGVTDTLLLVTTYVMLALIVVWCLASAVLAWLTFRRIGWARILLVVSASIAGLVCLLGSAMGAFLLVLPLLGAVVTVTLLLRADVGPWFSRR